MAEPIMKVHVTINPADISEINTPHVGAVMIPFTGSVQSELFTGEILPGGVDVQTVNTAGVRHMCAKYMFSGKDYTGAECKVFVENNAFSTPFECEKDYFTSTPMFITDSEALAPYLMANHFRGEGHGTPEGVDIWIFDTLKD